VRLTCTHAHLENERTTLIARLRSFSFLDLSRAACHGRERERERGCAIKSSDERFSIKSRLQGTLTEMYVFLTHCVGVLAGRSAPVGVSQPYSIPLDTRIMDSDNRNTSSS